MLSPDGIKCTAVNLTPVTFIQTPGRGPAPHSVPALGSHRRRWLQDPERGQERLETSVQGGQAEVGMLGGEDAPALGASPTQSPPHPPAHLCHPPADLALQKWVGAGSAPYGLTYREDLALYINRARFQELLPTLPPWAVPSPPAPALTPSSSSQMVSRRLSNVPVIKKPLFSKPFHSLLF